MHIGLAGFRLRKATLKAKVVRLLTFRGVIRFDNLVGPLLPRSKIYAPAANTVLASWLLVVWESVCFQLFLFCWNAFRLRCRHAANTKPLSGTVFLYKDYFSNFYEKQRQKVKEKIIWTFRIIETMQQVSEDYLKHLEDTNGLYEIKVQLGSDIFRIFCFFDKGKLIVLANGFQKKTQKTPKSEIEKALKIKKEYETGK
jgi:phage-related protein